ncbi:transposase [Nocardia sp. SYP-A9097]|uniref:transposase n=1 Tax=Nocardia sp. SYP-A9097 TaxID=2663237 RepID=UPI0035C88CFF
MVHYVQNVSKKVPEQVLARSSSPIHSPTSRQSQSGVVDLTVGLIRPDTKRIRVICEDPRRGDSSLHTVRSDRVSYDGALSPPRNALGLVKRIIRMLACSSDFWLHDCWIVDSTPVPCGMSRPTVKRSDLAGWAGYGYCASHSRFYWGLKLYLVCTPTGMPILWALADPKIGEREVLSAMLEVEAGVVAEHDGILLVCDEGFAGREFETLIGEYGITMLHPSREHEKMRFGEPLLKKVRQLIESVNDTLKGQLDLENHGGRSFQGVAIRGAQRVLAMAAAIWL